MISSGARAPPSGRGGPRPSPSCCQPVLTLQSPHTADNFLLVNKVKMEGAADCAASFLTELSYSAASGSNASEPERAASSGSGAALALVGALAAAGGSAAADAVAMASARAVPRAAASNILPAGRLHVWKYITRKVQPCFCLATSPEPCPLGPLPACLPLCLPACRPPHATPCSSLARLWGWARQARRLGCARLLVVRLGRPLPPPLRARQGGRACGAARTLPPPPPLPSRLWEKQQAQHAALQAHSASRADASCRCKAAEAVCR